MPTVTAQINDFALSNANGILVTDIQNENDSTPLNLGTFAMNRRDGGKLVSAYFQPKSFTINGILLATTYELLTTLIDTFKNKVTGTDLKFYRSDGTTTHMYKVATGNVSINRGKENLTFVPFSVTLKAIDPPFAYDATIGGDKTATSALAATGITVDLYTGTFVAGGTVKPECKLTLTVATVGDMTGLDIVDLTNFRTMNITRTFVLGDVIVIDSAAGTVKVNGEQCSYTGQLPDFGVGSNQIGLRPYTSTGLVLDQSQTLSNNQNILYLTTQRLAQSFTAGASNPLSRVQFVINKVGTPTGTITVQLCANNAGVPDTVLATTTIASTDIGTVYSWVNAVFASQYTMTSSTLYWLVLSVSAGCTLDNYYQIRSYTPDNYAGGTFRKSVDSGANYTTVSAYDLAFRTFKAIAGQKNDSVDSTSYVEDFTTTTKKDAGATTGNWDTSGHYLTMNGTAKTPTDTSTASGSNLSTMSDQQITTILFPVTVPVGVSCTIHTVVVRLKANVSTSACLIMRNSYNGSTVHTSSSQNVTSNSYSDFTFTVDWSVTSGSTYWIGIQGNDANVVSVQGLKTTSYTSYDSNVTIFSDCDDDRFDLYYKSTDSVYHTINFALTDYTTAEIGQTIEVDATNCDILSTSQVATTILLGSSTMQGYISADNGSNFQTIARDATAFATETIPTVIGTQLKYKASLTSPTVTKPYLTGLALYYRKGISLSATTTRGAESFVPNVTGNIQRVDLLLAKHGSPGDITVRIETDTAGSPSGTLVHADATKTLAHTTISADIFQWLTFNFPGAFSLTSGTTYWIVISAAATVNDANKWLILANNGLYAGGSLKKSTNSGAAYSAIASGEDILFRTYGAGGGNFNLSLDVTLYNRYL